MSLKDKIAGVDGPLMDESIVLVSWREDSWQRGDPMFDAIDDFHPIRTDRNLQQRGFAPGNNPEGHAGELQDSPACPLPLDDAGRH